MTPPTGEATPIPSVETRLSLVEREAEAIQHKLFGNGQPGALQLIEQRLGKIEEKIGRVLIVVGFLAGAAGLGVDKIMQLFGGGG